LPKGHKTSYQKEIFFRNNLSAQAEIITDDGKLFHQLTNQLQQVLQR